MTGRVRTDLWSLRLSKGDQQPSAIETARGLARAGERLTDGPRTERTTSCSPDGQGKKENTLEDIEQVLEERHFGMK